MAVTLTFFVEVSTAAFCLAVVGVELAVSTLVAETSTFRASFVDRLGKAGIKFLHVSHGASEESFPRSA